MSTKDWYQYYKRPKTHVYNNVEDVWTLKPTKIEFIHPELNHKNCYEKIRRSNLPSRLMSPLLKLKLDIYLTEERKNNSNMTPTARCPHCARIDYIGHIFMCPKNPYKKICDTIITLYKEFDENIALESIVNSDFRGSNEECYPLGWIFATLIDHIYEANKTNTTGPAGLKAKFQRDINTINSIENSSQKVKNQKRYLEQILAD